MRSINRWAYAAVGVIIMLFAGLVYAWTVLQAPIAAMFPDWTKGSLSLTFTTTMAFFCIGGLVGGLMQKKFKPRVLVWGSAVLFLAGFAIASTARSLTVLYLGFGVLAGLATGLSYNAVMSSVSCWFPDKQGFISGALLMGFGLSSFIIGKVYTAVTPTDGTGVWRTTFIVFGVVLFFVMAIAGFFVVKPDRSWKVPTTSNATESKMTYGEIGAKEMLKKPSFWLYTVWATFLSFSGLAIISQGTPMAMEACPGITMNVVSTIVGLISIFNGIGRIISGALFDKIGRFWTMLIGGVAFIIAMALLTVALTGHSIAFLVAAYIVTGFAYGCVPPTNSAFVNIFYGQRNYPANLSIVNMSILIASFGSTVAGIVFDVTRSYMTIIVIVIGLIVFGTIVSCFIRKPKASV